MQGAARQNSMPLSNPRSRKRLKAVIPYVIKETWTHDFFLLASPMEEKTLTLTKCSALLQTGTEKTCNVFKDKEGSFDHVRETLEKEIPKLATQNGAFESMRADMYRGSASNPFVPILMWATALSLASTTYHIYDILNIFSWSHHPFTHLTLCTVVSCPNQYNVPNCDFSRWKIWK